MTTTKQCQKCERTFKATHTDVPTLRNVDHCPQCAPWAYKLGNAGRIYA